MHTHTHTHTHTHDSLIPHRQNKEILSRKFEVKMISERLVEQLKNAHPSFNKDRHLPKEKDEES